LDAPAKSAKKTWNINTSLERDKASKDIATDLSQLGYFLLLLIYGEELSKDNAEAGKSWLLQNKLQAYKKKLH
jgi:hypothetical protein